METADPGDQQLLRLGIEVVVDLDGAWVVKANPVNVEPSPAAVRVGMRVRLTTYAVGVDDEGTEAIAFAYEPADQEA